MLWSSSASFSRSSMSCLSGSGRPTLATKGLGYRLELDLELFVYLVHEEGCEPGQCRALLSIEIMTALLCEGQDAKEVFAREKGRLRRCYFEMPDELELVETVLDLGIVGMCEETVVEDAEGRERFRRLLLGE